jgi:hypothetical protein
VPMFRDRSIEAFTVPPDDHVVPTDAPEMQPVVIGAGWPKMPANGFRGALKAGLGQPCGSNRLPTLSERPKIASDQRRADSRDPQTRRCRRVTRPAVAARLVLQR